MCSNTTGKLKGDGRQQQYTVPEVSRLLEHDPVLEKKIHNQEKFLSQLNHV